MPTIEPTLLSPTSIDLEKLDSDAVRATQRLASRGYEAFLVGGCVRDHLLDRSPKDYDIATSARPQQVKRTFPRNCRIIGRRFKLAHLHFNRNTKILEVSTFRRTPEADGGDDDLLITRDNEFGTAEEDALRRDFTVNALFFDPTKDCILDWCNGLTDLKNRVIRTIGDPRVRFREDPVRILRAAKFAGRLGFSIEPETFAAMAETANDLVRAAPPRLLEEILRLLRGGHALDSFQLLRDVGALKSLVPVVADFLTSARHDQRVGFWRLLEALDHRVQSGHVPQNAVLLSVLMSWPVLARAEADPNRSPSSVAEELLGPLGQELKLPRRDAGCLKRICGVQHRFEQSGESRRFRTGGFIRGPYFPEALELFEMRVDAETADPEALKHWQDLASEHGHDDDDDSRDDPDAIAKDRAETAPRKRRRRRRGKKRDTDGDLTESEATAEAGDELPDEADEQVLDEDEETRPPRRKRRRRRRRKAATGDEAPAAADDAETGEETDESPQADDGSPEADDESPRPRRRRRRRKKAADDAIDETDTADASTGDEADDDKPATRKKAAKKAAKKVAAKKVAAKKAASKKTAKKTTKKTAKKTQRKSGRGRRGGDKPRDVDVVPRFRDRRGKVEVLEPPAMDLSAFDVELDPKRVPTFGTIVEGKKRTKRRSPRVRDDGTDDYKPPPPPGSDDKPPPPPPSDDSDTFGDW